MKAWEKFYDDKVLDKATDLIDDVEIVSNDGVEIVAQVSDFKVTTYIQYNSPSYLSCNCPSPRTCEHEAALVYYLSKHRELYFKEPDFDEVFERAGEGDLKRFLLEEFDSNPDLKDRFFKEFSDSPIDRNHYIKKLDDVFKRGEGRDFDLHGIYDLDLMESGLYDFIFTDISDILSVCDEDFACDLLVRIAKLLNDEIISTYDSWYDLADRFMEKVSVLSFSIYLDSERLDEIYANTDHIMSCL